MKIGLPGLLFVIFLCCKIFGVLPIAAWSWWWVTAPLWISFIIWIVIMAAVIALKTWAESD